MLRLTNQTLCRPFRRDSAVLFVCVYVFVLSVTAPVGEGGLAAGGIPFLLVSPVLSMLCVHMEVPWSTSTSAAITNKINRGTDMFIAPWKRRPKIRLGAKTLLLVVTYLVIPTFLLFILNNLLLAVKCSKLQTHSCTLPWTLQSCIYGQSAFDSVH